MNDPSVGAALLFLGVSLVATAAGVVYWRMDRLFRFNHWRRVYHHNMRTLPDARWAWGCMLPFGVALLLLAEDVVPVEGDDSGLFVAWIGLPCEDRPSLQIREGDAGTEILLNKGPQREGDACPFYPHYFAVRLDFASPINADDVELSVAQRSE